MQAPVEDASAAAPPQSGRRLRFELVFASVLLAFGFFVLPAAIFFVGSALLGPYGNAAGAGAFYADYFGDLGSFSGRTWFLALGPALIAYVVRLIFIGVRASGPVEASAVPADAPRAHRADHQRVEPRVTLD